MSIQFCYLTTPNVEEEAFRLLVLYDQKSSIASWNTTQNAFTTALNLLLARVSAAEVALDELHKALLRVEHDLTELGA